MPTVYVSPTGSGSKSGSSAADAMAFSALDSAIRTAGAGGSVLLLADQGPYKTYSAVNITAGGQAGAPVTIRGVNAAGEPAAPMISGTRAADWTLGAANGSEVFKLLSGANHLRFETLAFENQGNGVFRVGADIAGLTIRSVDATNVQRFIENTISGLNTTASINGLTVQDVEVHGYSKSAIRLRYDTRNVLIEDVLLDSEAQSGDEFAMGVHLDGTAHDVVMRRVTSMNNQDLGDPDYWNGDGFATEGGVYNILFEDTVASGNTDGGYDLKSMTTRLVRAHAEDNKRNYRVWNADTVIEDSTSGDTNHRGGTGGESHVWLGANARATMINSRLADADAGGVIFDLSEGGAVLSLSNTRVAMFEGTTLAQAGGSRIDGLDMSLVTYITEPVTRDTTAPTVAAVTLGAHDGLLTVGETVTLSVKFTEGVIVTGGAPSLALNTGGAASLSSVSGDTLTFSYTVKAGEAAADLAVTGLNLNGAAVKDAAGNAAVTTGAASNPAGLLKVDGTPLDTAAPTVTGVTLGVHDGLLKLGETVTLSVKFSEGVAVTGGTPSLALNTGGVATLAAASGDTLTFSYTVKAGESAPDLAVTGFSLNGAAVKDAAGNAAVTGGALTNPAGVLIVDGTPFDATSPIVTAVTLGAHDGVLAVGETVTVSVKFSEGVSVTGGTPSLALNTGGVATLAAASGDTLTFSYTVKAGEAAADLAVTALSLNGAAVKDAAGNAAVTTGAVSNPDGLLRVDGSPPKVMSVALSDTLLGMRDTAQVKVVFSEAPVGFDLGDFVYDKAAGALTGLVQDAADASGKTWTAAYTPAAGVTVASTTVSVQPTGWTDAAGNAPTGGAVSAAFKVDTQAPVPVILSADQGASAKSKLLMTGQSEAGSTVQVLLNGKVAASTMAGADGAWTLSADRVAKNTLVQVQATDEAGNIGRTEAVKFAGLTAGAALTTAQQPSATQTMVHGAGSDGSDLAGFDAATPSGGWAQTWHEAQWASVLQASSLHLA